MANAYVLLLAGFAVATTGCSPALNPAPTVEKPAMTGDPAFNQAPSVKHVLEAMQVDIESDLQDRMQENLAAALTDVMVTPAVALADVEN